MRRFLVCGIGTSVGKSVVSSILTKVLDGVYWKPIQCGERDTELVKKLFPEIETIPSCYSFAMPASPHLAAISEATHIDISTIKIPQNSVPLIIEGIGGVSVPITYETTTLDLFQRWDVEWIVVADNYLGSINHTLLTIETLKNRGLRIRGIIFNRSWQEENMQAVMNLAHVPFLAQMNSEESITQETITNYVHKWAHLRTLLLGV